MSLEQQILLAILAANYLIAAFASTLLAWMAYEDRRPAYSPSRNRLFAWAAEALMPLGYVHFAVNVLLLVYVAVRLVLERAL